MPFDQYIPIYILLVQGRWDCPWPSIVQEGGEQPDIEVPACVGEDLVEGYHGRYPYSSGRSVKFGEDKPGP
jgi:hypothetical protein